MSIKDILKRSYENTYLPLSRKCFSRRLLKKQVKENHENLAELTQEETKEIRKFWNKYGLEDFSLDTHRILYAKTGIRDPRFVSQNIFYNHLRLVLNNQPLARVWSDKNYLDLFLGNVETVDNVIRVVSGRLLNQNFELVTWQKAQELMNQYEQLVTKPSLMTEKGIDVELIEKPYDLKKIIRSYGQNFCIQVPLEQHHFFNNFNESSINSMRINTILLNTEAYVVNSFVKIGEPGQFADNRGENRYLLGFDDMGVLKDYCVDSKLNIRYEIPSGFKFAGKQIPYVDRVYKIATEAHKKMAHFGLAYWDIVLQSNNQPVILEANLRAPNTIFIQAATGPFFGKHTEELLEFYLSHRNQVN